MYRTFFIWHEFSCFLHSVNLWTKSFWKSLHYHHNSFPHLPHSQIIWTESHHHELFHMLLFSLTDWTVVFKKIWDECHSDSLFACIDIPTHWCSSEGWCYKSKKKVVWTFSFTHLHIVTQTLKFISHQQISVDMFTRKWECSYHFSFFFLVTPALTEKNWWDWWETILLDSITSLMYWRIEWRRRTG